MSAIITFGKHKSKSVSELIIEDPKYIIWLAKQQWVSPTINQEIKASLGTMIIPFGRYEGKSIGEVKIIDYQYYSWIIKDFVE